MSEKTRRSRNTLLRIAFGVGAAWGQTVVGVVVQLIQLPLLYRFLEREVLGAWLVFSSIAVFLMLWDMGLGTTFARSMAYSRATPTGPAPGGDPLPGSGSPQDMLRTVGLTYWLLASLLYAAALPAGLWYLDRLSFSPGAGRAVTTAWMTYAVGCAVHVGGLTPLQALAGLGDVGIERCVRTGANLFGLAMNVTVLLLGGGINALSWAFVVRGLAMWVAAGLILRWRYPWSIERSGRFSWRCLGGLRGDALRIFVTRLGAFMILQTPGLIMARMLGPARVPDYMALWMVVQMGIMGSLAVGEAVVPHAATAFAAGERTLFLRLHRNAVRTGLILIGLWCALFALWASPAMRLWLGPGRFLGYSVLAPMLLTGVLEVHHSFNSHFVWAAGRWPFAPLAVAAGALNILLGIWWVGFAGERGMAWATCTSQMLTNNWFVVYYALRLLRLRPGEYVVRVVLPAAAIVSAAALAAGGMKDVVARWAPLAGYFRGVSLNSLLSMLLGATAAVGCAALLFWRLGLDARGRHAVRAEFRRLVLRGS